LSVKQLGLFAGTIGADVDVAGEAGVPVSTRVSYITSPAPTDKNIPLVTSKLLPSSLWPAPKWARALGTLDAGMVGKLQEKLARLGFAVFPVVLPFAPLHLSKAEMTGKMGNVPVPCSQLDQTLHQEK